MFPAMYIVGLSCFPQTVFEFSFLPFCNKKGIMYNIKILKEKNRIYISGSEISREDFEKGIEELELVCLNMKPNFTCVLDLREYGLLIENHVDLIKKGQERIWGAGLGKAIRIVPRSMLVFYKSELAKKWAFFYEAEYVTSLQEADEILDRYQEQLDNQNRNNIKEMYKIIDMNNWEDNQLYANFKDASVRLKQLRGSGRQHAIIVNSKTLLDV